MQFEAPQSYRKRPRQARSQRMVGILLDATEAVLRSHGYVGASTNRIARSAEVSVGSLYQYFGDKDGLIGAALERALAREAGALAGLAEDARGRPLAEAVSLVVDAVVKSRLAQRALLAVLAEHGLRFGRGTPVEQLAHYRSGHPDPIARLVAARRVELRGARADTIPFASSVLLNGASFAHAVCSGSSVRSAALVRLLAAAIAEHLVAEPPRAGDVPELPGVEIAEVPGWLQDASRSSGSRAALFDELVGHEQTWLTALAATGATPEAVCEGMLRFWARCACELGRAVGAAALTRSFLEPHAWALRTERRTRCVRSWLASLHEGSTDDALEPAVFVLCQALPEFGLLFAQAREPAEIREARIADAGALLGRCARLAPLATLTSASPAE